MSKTYIIIDRDSRVDDRGWIVKIGKSDDPRKRLAALQTANAGKLVLAAVIPGGGWEPLLHEMCDRFRLNGEWFRLDLGRIQVLATIASESLEMFGAYVDSELLHSMRDHQMVAHDDTCFAESEAFHAGWEVGEEYERSKQRVAV